MPLLKNIIRFLIKSKLLIASCSVGMVFTAYGLLTLGEQQAPVALWLSVGCATFIVYNLAYLFYTLSTSREEKLNSALYAEKPPRLMYPLLLLAFVVLGGALFFLPQALIQWLMILGIVSFLYHIPDALLKKPYRSLRSIPLLKIFLIAGVWAFIGSYLPNVFIGLNPAIATRLFIVQFLFILGITLPFDVRDYRQDKVYQLLTIPGMIGIKASIMMALLLILLYGCLLLLWFSETVSFALAHTAVCMLLLLFAFRKRPYWYYTGLLDGLILLQFLLLFVFL